ncbi:AAA family ATPase [archaeon]|nr:AAA family ATPase [archaeon]MBL7056939.1 AAA family ATPase [Candidatus Woesearchaeota archaeon]
MKLIIIYGPPGVGKLTISEEIAKINGYKIFQNNLSFHLTNCILEHETEEFRQLNRKIKYLIIEEAAKQGFEGLISTVCLQKGVSDSYIEEAEKIVKKYGGKLYLIHLSCDEKVLFERVPNKDREKHGKVTDIEFLKIKMKEKDLISPIDNVESLEVDTTKMRPEEAAKKIIEYISKP